MQKNIEEYMREVFKRFEDKSVLNIEVDIDASEYKEENPWLFSVFVKYDSLDDNKDGYEEFLETKESLIIALEHKVKARYVGSRIVDGWNEFYFYAKDSKKLDTIVAKILTPSSYTFESNVVKDAKWGFYENQLFPTELEFCHIQSSKIIFLLEEEGDNLSVPRDVEHYISFETPTQKNRFVNRLDIDGFAFKDDISSEDFEYGVALVKNHKVTEEEVEKVVNELFVHIKKEHGYYEGWSTVLVDESIADM